MVAGKSLGASLFFLGGGGTAGYGIKLMLNSEPDFTLLEGANEFEKTYLSGKFGNSGNNKTLFVDPDSSQSWWEYTYVHRLKSTDLKAQTEEFQGINVGYSGSDSKALNKVCRKNLLIEKKKLVKVELKKDLWTFCSRSGEVPTDVGDRPESKVYEKNSSKTDSDKFGDLDSNKDKLVDGDKTENEEWWEWLFENVLKNRKNDSDVSSEFKAATKGYSSTENEALNKICKTAYEKKAADLVNVAYKTSLYEFCSKDGNVPESVRDMPKIYLLSDTESSTHTITDQYQLGNVSANKSKLISDIAKNEEGWNWIYENKLKVDLANDTKKTDIYSSFSSVSKGYSSTDGDTAALNKVCRSAYEQEASSLKADSEKYRKTIAIYCTKDKDVHLVLPDDKPVVTTSGSD